MSGNFVIGIIVFTILVIVNFVVITKGSGRIAEVAARFHLDAMPGKQMAIDADLSAGLIDENEARRAAQDARRRKRLLRRHGRRLEIRARRRHRRACWSSSSTSSAASSSASRSRACRSSMPRSTYTLLTVGDGLVTQVPALIVSTAAGLLVSKAGISGAADKALMRPAVRLSESARPVVRRDAR